MNSEVIANPEEIKDYEYLTRCMTCTEFLFLSKNPQYCVTCEKSVHCK